MASGRYELMMREALKSGDTARIIKVAKDIASKRKDPLKKKRNLDFFTKLGEDIKKNPKPYEASIKKFRTIDKNPKGVKNTNVTPEELAAANRINKEEANAIARREAAAAEALEQQTGAQNEEEEPNQILGLNVTSTLQPKEAETAEEELLKRIKEEIQTAPNPNWAGLNARLVKLARGVRDTPLEEEYNDLKQVVLEKLIDAKKPGRTVFRTPEERDALIATRTAGFKTSVERERATAALKTLETRINTYEGPWSELLEPVIQQGPDFRGTELETRYNELKEYVVDKVLAEKEELKQQKNLQSKTKAAEEEDLREQLLAINRIRKAEDRLQESPKPTDESEMFGHAEAPVTTNANINALFASPKERLYIAKFKELANARRNPTPTRRIGDVAKGLSPANLVGKLVQESASAVGAATKQPNVSVEGEGAKRLVVPGEADTAEETPELNTGFQELLQQQESQGSFKQSEEESEFTTLKPDEEDEELRAKAEEAFFTRKQAEDQSTTLAEAIGMFVFTKADKEKVGSRLTELFTKVKSFKVPEATVLAKFNEAAVPTKRQIVNKLLKDRIFQPFTYSGTLLETFDLEDLNEQLKAEAAERVFAEKKAERARVLAEKKAARATAKAKKGGSRQYRRYTHKQR